MIWGRTHERIQPYPRLEILYLLFNINNRMRSVQKQVSQLDVNLGGIVF